MQYIHKLISLAFLLLLTMGVTSCSADDDNNVVRQEDAGTPVPLTLTIADGGYIHSSDPDTRAKEEGYTTLFTDGDRIGVLVKSTLDGDTSYRNLPFTYRNVGGWTTSEGFYYEIGATYTAYYPYTETVVDEQSYNDHVAQFVPKDDQSTYADYTGSDLMTGTGILGSTSVDGKRSLTIALTHQMSLIVVEMPKGKYIFPTADGTLVYHPQAVVSPLVTWSTSSKPYLMGQGTYRYLVKPSSTQKSLVGSYITSVTNYVTIALPINAPKGKYKTYLVDKNTVINNQVRPLEMGDFYYADGTVLPGTTENLPAGCVAVVYWVGNIAGDNYGMLDAKFPQGTHALAMSLDNLINPRDFTSQSAEYIDWTYSNYENTTDISDWLAKGGWGASKPSGFNSMTAIDILQGYANTFAMKEFNKTLKGFVDQSLTLIVALDAYNTTVPAPANSSGWYLPSVRDIEVVVWMSQEREGLGRQILKAGGEWNNDESYWTSTESDKVSAYLMNFHYNSNAGRTNKYTRMKARAVIAF